MGPRELQGDERLVEPRLGLDRQQVRTRRGEELDALRVQVGEFEGRQAVVAGVLRAVGSQCAGRPDRPGDPPGIGRPRAIAPTGDRLACQLDAAPDGPARRGGLDAGGREPPDAGLVARRHEHLRTGVEEGLVHGHDGVGGLQQQTGRPQRGVEVVPGRRQRRGQPAVEDQRSPVHGVTDVHGGHGTTRPGPFGWAVDLLATGPRGHRDPRGRRRGTGRPGT